jgi:hypothetical protein
MIDALIKRVSETYKCYEMYAHRGKNVQLDFDKSIYMFWKLVNSFKMMT